MRYSWSVAGWLQLMSDGCSLRQLRLVWSYMNPTLLSLAIQWVAQTRTVEDVTGASSAKKHPRSAVSADVLRCDCFMWPTAKNKTTKLDLYFSELVDFPRLWHISLIWGLMLTLDSSNCAFRRIVPPAGNTIRFDLIWYCLFILVIKCTRECTNQMYRF